MKEKRPLFKRTFLALCLMAVCWIPTRAMVLLGDLNGDGTVNIADVTAMIDYILHRDGSAIDLDAADMDSDGDMGIADVVALIDLILDSQDTPIDDDPDWVDLGLPSGTIWATRNVGASSPEEYGTYFAWGEVEPKDCYDGTTYKWYQSNYDAGAGVIRSGYTKYSIANIEGYNGFTDGKTELDPEDDAAYVNWGVEWRMPTKEQIYELCDKCTWTWTTQNGTNGRVVTGPNGNTLFLPAAGGFFFSGSLYRAGSWGYYWSRTLGSVNASDAFYLTFNYLQWYYLDDYFRYCGFTVRAVRVS